jgi:hypothetical protein
VGNASERILAFHHIWCNFHNNTVDCQAFRQMEWVFANLVLKKEAIPQT